MQLATLLIGLISATALWSGVQALNQQARTSYDRAAAVFGGARTAVLIANNEVTIPQKLFADLRRAGWPVSPMVEGRLAIGRALQARPSLLLADEPTGNLDEATADDVLALTRDLVAQSGCSLLMVTHSTRLAATLDRHVNLSAGLIT